MKKLLISLAVLAVLAGPAYGQTLLPWGVPLKSLDANSGGAATTGITYATNAGTATLLTWTTEFSSAPASVTILLQGSLDNSTWYTLDTSTSTGGEARTVSTSAKFIRAYISAIGSTVDTTVTFHALRQPTTGVFSGGSIISQTSFAQPTLFANGTVSAPSIAFASDPTRGFRAEGSASIAFGDNNTSVLFSAGTSGGVQLRSDGGFKWSSTSDASGSSDVALWRDAGNVLALRNGTIAQAFRIYNTSDGSNWERGELAWSGGALFLTSGAAGAGVARSIIIRSAASLYLRSNNGSAGWQVSTGQHLLAETDNTYDIGGPANRPRTGYFGTSIFVGESGYSLAESGGNLIIRNGSASTVGTFTSAGDFTTGGGDVTTATVVFGANGSLRNSRMRIAAISDGDIRLSNGNNTNTYNITLADWGTTLSAEGVSVADAGTLNLGAAPLGKLTVSVGTDNEVCTFILSGSSTAVRMVDDGAANCDDTKDNAGTVNVYYDGTAYFLQNNRGGSRTVRLVLIGA